MKCGNYDLTPVTSHAAHGSCGPLGAYDGGLGSSQPCKNITGLYRNKPRQAVVVSGLGAKLDQLEPAIATLHLGIEAVTDPLSWQPSSSIKPIAFICQMASGDIDPERFVKDLIERFPLAIVILVTNDLCPRQLVASMRAGAWDVMMIPVSLEAALTSLEAGLAQRGILLPNPNDQGDFPVRWQSLSPREREILQLIVSGKVTKVIAHELGISVKTVDVHRTSIKRKFGTSTLASLISYVVRQSNLAVAH